MWLCKNKEKVCCTIFGKVVAYIVIVVSVLALICTAYHKVVYYKSGRHMGRMGKMGMGQMMDYGWQRLPNEKNENAKQMNSGNR